MNIYVEEMEIIQSSLFEPARDYGSWMSSDQLRGPFYYTTTYKNNIGVPVTVVERDGFRHVVPNNPGTNQADLFVVLRTYHIRHTMHVNMVAWGESLPQNCTPHQRKLYTRYLEIKNSQVGHRAYNDVVVSIDYMVADKNSAKTFTRYVSDLDIVVSTLDLYKTSAHPSQHSRYPGDDGTNTLKPYISEDATLVKVELIDNNQLFDKRFVYLMGECLEIRPTKDATRQNGVYITSSRLDKNSDNIKPTRITKFCTVQEAEEKYGVCTNQEAARAGGDIKLLAKLNFEELEREVSVMKQNFAKEKLMLESDNMTKQKEAATRAESLEVMRHSLRIAEHDLKVADAKLKEAEHSRQITISELEDSRKAADIAFVKRESELEMEKLMIKDKYEREKHIRTELSEEAKLLRAEVSDKTKYKGDKIKFLHVVFMAMTAASVVVFKFVKFLLTLKTT
jgi:hypothetical protein